MIKIEPNTVLRGTVFEPEIRELSEKSLHIISTLFQDGIQQGAIARKSPAILADVVWALFSGIVLLEESKKVITLQDNYLKDAFDTAFDIFLKGIRN